jgi:hypothetical protein
MLHTKEVLWWLSWQLADSAGNHSLQLGEAGQLHAMAVSRTQVPAGAHTPPCCRICTADTVGRCVMASVWLCETSVVTCVLVMLLTAAWLPRGAAQADTVYTLPYQPPLNATPYVPNATWTSNHGPVPITTSYTGANGNSYVSPCNADGTIVTSGPAASGWLQLLFPDPYVRPTNGSSTASFTGFCTQLGSVTLQQHAVVAFNLTSALALTTGDMLGVVSSNNTLVSDPPIAMPRSHGCLHAILHNMCMHLACPCRHLCP